MSRGSPSCVIISMERRVKCQAKLDRNMTEKMKASLKQKKDQKMYGHSRWYMSLKTIVFAINLLIVLACTATLIFQGSQCLIRFFRTDTKAILSVKPTGDATFFALTVCPRFEEAYNATALNQLGIDKKAYKDGSFFGNPELPGFNNDDVNGFDVFHQVSFSLREIMHEVKISTSSVSNPLIRVRFDRELDENKTIWTEVYDSTYGRCYQMELGSEVTALGVINLELISKMGVHVYLHHPGQYMDVDSKTKIYGVLANMLFIDLTHELTVNTLGAEGEIPCNATMDWEYDTCVTTEINRILTQEFGCIVPWLPPTNETQVCKFDESTEVGRQFKQSVMDRYDFLASNGQRLMCPVPCSTIEVFLGLPFGGEYSPDRAHMKLYVKSTVKMKRTVLDYTWVSMLAEIGGYTGLLLGISVVNVTNYLDRFFRLFRSP